MQWDADTHDTLDNEDPVPVHVRAVDQRRPFHTVAVGTPSLFEPTAKHRLGCGHDTPESIPGGAPDGCDHCCGVADSDAAVAPTGCPPTSNAVRSIAIETTVESRPFVVTR